MDIENEVGIIKADFFNTADIVDRKIMTPSRMAVAIYLDAMIDAEQLEFGIIQPILETKGDFTPDYEGLCGVVKAAMGIKSFADRLEAESELSAGDCMLLVEGAAEYFIIGIKKYPIRAVAEPPTSAVLKGPREGFTEDLKTNMVLLRRRFRSTKLVYVMQKAGRFTDTSIAVCFLKGIADEKLVEGVLEKIKNIDIDGIVDSSYVAKFLETRNYSVFRQTGTAEKPDIVAAKLLEGRIAVIVDGSPIVLTLPFLFVEDFQDSQDYYKRPIRASIVRAMRLLAVFFAVFLPGAFVALQMHQFQMLPLKLLITIINSISGIPFSPPIEMLLALLLFEVLGEASIRMPRYVGMAISIVGAIILGDTAVKAGLLSSLTVLITALSGIGLYAIPDEVGTFSVIRIALVFVAASTGLFGIILAGIGVMSYAVSLEVYGTAYFAPFAPLIPSDLKDSVFKLSVTDMKKRPESLNNENITRAK